jgi:hypothetical protein
VACENTEKAILVCGSPSVIDSSVWRVCILGAIYPDLCSWNPLRMGGAFRICGLAVVGRLRAVIFYWLAKPWADRPKRSAHAVMVGKGIWV